MDIIYKKTGISTTKYTFTGCFTSGDSHRRFHRRDLLILRQKKRKRHSKRVQELLSQIPKGFTIAVQDESIFVHDTLVRRKLWLPKGIRPVVKVTGLHQRTCVFGTLTLKGKQLFRQYDVFNQDTFLDYLKQVKEKLGKKVILFTDRESKTTSIK